MPTERKQDAALDFEPIRRRIKAHREFLKNDPCYEEQKHLDSGTRERVYWHYGYMVALLDLFRYLGIPEGACEPTQPANNDGVDAEKPRPSVMPTESNNRQLSEISDSKCEEVAKRLVLRIQSVSLLQFPDWITQRVFIACDETLLELQRETRRETLMEAVQDCGELPVVYENGDECWCSCMPIIRARFEKKAAELERKAKEGM